ncbi:MAG: cobyrinate a,c-diamide synthase [Selenomonadaceae bacterium]|nr:cobyrinate a,c-diamide synthase [Selenomonadaceae bacterium]
MSARQIPRVVIAAPMSGSGKTTVVTGLLAAMRAHGVKAQSYKIGPDYIDPGYHALASGRPAHNLDTWLVSKERLADIFISTMADADVAVIEGVMGLYDGGKNGVSSTAEIAKLLKAPVLLVVNAKSMGESAAALVLGFKQYDPGVNLAGVILNRLGSDTHRMMIEEALEKLGVPVFGAIKRNDAMTMPERHLGLVPVEENARERETVEEIGRVVGAAVDVESIVALGKTAPPLEIEQGFSQAAETKARIAVARDEAFSFYYPESLAVLRQKGADIVFFSPLHDERLPEADGLILGGGFPEMFAKELYENESMRASIKAAAEKGMPIYAECGGFMYLMRRVTDFDGNSFPMLGVIPGEVAMNKKLQTVGYVSAEMMRDTVLGSKGTVLHGHEFHFSSECEPETGADYPRAFTFRKTRNPSPYAAGYAKGNILGSYLHLHFAGSEDAAASFVTACQNYVEKRA